jgi:hypothetical protein
MDVKRGAAVIVAATAFACGQEGPAPPACGIVLVGGPTVILQTFQNVTWVITDVPQGLPASLPARAVGQDQSDALVGYGEPGVVIGFQGVGLPVEDGFGLLVQDDSTGVVHGVLIYGSTRPPPDFPTLGIVSDNARTVPLYGVRVTWHQISNPRCPLLGSPTQ